MNSPWRFELWGGLRARCLDAPDEASLEAFHTRKTAALLAFLAWHRGWHGRELLAEELWPDAPPQKGRNSLRVALSALRQQFAEGQPCNESSPSAWKALEITRAAVRLAPGATTDVEEFRALLVQSQELKQGDHEAHLRALEGAVGLVKGPFLPGFYEDWIAGASAALEDEFLGALRALIALREEQGDLLGALDAARRGAAVAPLREGVMRDIVRLGLACNENDNARAEFEAWRTRLRRLDGEEAPRGADEAQWLNFTRPHQRATTSVGPNPGASENTAIPAPTLPGDTANLPGRPANLPGGRREFAGGCREFAGGRRKFAGGRREFAGGRRASIGRARVSGVAGGDIELCRARRGAGDAARLAGR